jgi:hypothetical protein
MSKEAPTPTNDEPTAPVLDKDQAVEWAGVMEEQAKAKEEPETPDEEEEEEQEQPTDGDDGDDDDSDDTEDEEESDDEEEAPDEEYTDPVTPVAVEDPGEYQPKDYSFEIEVDGKTVKITSPEESAEFAEKNAEKLGAAQLVKLMTNTTKMSSGLERDKEAHEQAKAKFEEQQQYAAAQQQSIQNIAGEVEYLVSRGKLPPVDRKYRNADWSDPLVASQPGVREQVELLTYMRTENEARIKAGLQPLTSALDAFNAWSLEDKNTQAKETRKKQSQARKKAGSRVSGTSPSPVNIAPKGISVGRTLNLNDIDSF